MYCPTEGLCERECHFDPASDSFNHGCGEEKFRFITYTCRHCREYQKTFALRLKATNDGGLAVKLGESPPFAPRTPTKLKKLVEPDRDRYMKGRSAESYGLGVGAFAYYRQVVENIKGQLFEEIVRVANLRPGNEALIQELEAAKKEQQFKKAVEGLKHSLPPQLLYKGHNPLMLLHETLSVGLHAGTDEECLELAQTIRLVLTDLAERIAFVLKDEKGLDEGISKLLEIKRRRETATGEPQSAPIARVASESEDASSKRDN